MPPRFTYGAISFGNQPTWFRAATRDELVPTLKQLQSKHPDAVLMWFSRGRLWKSEEEAEEARRQRFAERDQSRPRGGDDRRGRDWRPGGQHKDPRDRFKVPRDVKRARFKSQSQRDRFDPRPGDQGPPAPPSDDRPPRRDDTQDRGEWRGPRPENRGPRPDDRAPRPENRGPRPEGRGPRPDNRPPRRDDRQDRGEWRGPRPENRGRPDSRGPRPDDR